MQGELLESTTLQQQAANNTKEQFANSPDLTTELTKAIIGALDAHTAMSTQDICGGVVVAGFGDRDHFPSVRVANVEARVLDRLRYKPDGDRDCAIERNMNGAIIPFAQTEVVELFIEGIDPRVAKLAYGYVGKALRDYPERILDTVDGISDDMKGVLLKEWRSVGDKLFEEFKREVEKLNSDFMNPLLQVVSALPKDELGELAEALVSITSLKRKVSLSAQTVGGPIDVAIISKGDGLVWIKRKHYFRPELNPTFFQNYFYQPDRGPDAADAT